MSTANGHKPLQFQVETITPQIAGTMLGTMQGNRPLRRMAVNRYAREMLAGKWRLNGEAIKVSKRGRLVDGQHRLNAIIMANIPVAIYVLRGVDDEAMITLDTGIGRTYYDATEIRGAGVHKMAGPIARLWYGYEQGSPTVRYTPSHQEIEDIISRHGSIPGSAAFVNKLKIVRSRCRGSVQGFVHSYAAEMWDREMADLFMHTLNDGTGLKVDDPIYLLRRRLVDDETTNRSDANYVLALSIKAWNLWITGESAKSLRWRTAGEVPEPFPRFVRDVVPTVETPERKEAVRAIRAASLAQHRTNPKPKGAILRPAGRV